MLVTGFFKQEPHSTEIHAEEELREDKNSVPDTQKLREKLSFKVTVGVSRNEKASKSLCNKERSEFDKAILLLNCLLCKISMTF